MAGDSSADSGNPTGSGDDLLDLGPGDRGLAIGDHNTNTPGRTASGAGNDRISGGHANDLLIGDSAADNVIDAGHDELEGLSGDDILFGDNTDWTGGHTTGTIGGDDRLSGDPGDDALFGGPANDALDGGTHTDHCDGEAGDDAFANCETIHRSP
jgi:Ca2+-binding RTX toxin-like protein